MKLREMTSRKGSATRALKEHFNINANLSKLTLKETKMMMRKVKSLISEARISKTGHSEEHSPSYLKLVFLEQALKEHEAVISNSRIVFENEEVVKSQVVLGAQDMVDTLQKMVENISDMLVKELPAVVDGVVSEFGTNEGEQFNSQATDALTQLQAAISQAKSGMQSALGVITGQGGGFDQAPEAGTGTDSMDGMEMGGDDQQMPGMDDQESDLGDMSDMEDEGPDLGRGMR